jgi:SlyX protein
VLAVASRLAIQSGEEFEVSQDRFEDLEVRIAYQDQLLHELNEAVTRQQAAIIALERRCDLLVERVRALGETTPDETGDERPPHY